MHFYYFLADIVIWLTLGVLIGLTFYPDKRVKRIWRKLSFVATSVVSMLLGGLYASLNYGLPDVGLSLSNTFFAVGVTVCSLSYFFVPFRNYLIKHVSKLRVYSFLPVK